MKNSLMDTSNYFKNHQSFADCDFFFSDINPKTKDITLDIYNYEKTEKGEVTFWSSVGVWISL